MAKDGTSSHEANLIGQKVAITCLDRDNTVWSDVTLAALDDKSALVEWSARGVLRKTLIPRSNISHLEVKYNSGADAEEPAAD